MRLGLDGSEALVAWFLLPRAWRGQLLGVPLQGVAHRPTWGAGTAQDRVPSLPDPQAGHTWPASAATRARSLDGTGYGSVKMARKSSQKLKNRPPGVFPRYVARAGRGRGVRGARVRFRVQLEGL